MKERVQRALSSCAGWPGPSNFGGGHGAPVERGCPFPSFVSPCGVGSFERIVNALN